MIPKYQIIITICICSILFGGCKHPVKMHEDEVYSRHLQRHVNLTIITTPMPEQKSDMNLLLVNDNDFIGTIEAKKIIDSLYKKKLIQPLTLVGIQGKAADEYGMGEINRKAEKYNEFISDELLPFIRKKTTVRKFNSVAIFGCGIAGTSALDIVWNYADKFDKVGIFSGDFSASIPGDTVNTAIQVITSSRKRPKFQGYMYANETNNNTEYVDAQALLAVLNKKNISTAADITFITNKTSQNNIVSWRAQFPAFLLWAFGK